MVRTFKLPIKVSIYYFEKYNLSGFKIMLREKLNENSNFKW
jgi:hypothetical protein